MRRFPTLPFLIATAAVVLTACAGAEAAQVTVGSPMKAIYGGALCSGPSGTWANSTLAEPGAYVTSPVSGAVVGWKMNGNYSGGPFKLRVLRPAGAGKYTGVGSSAPVSPVSGPQSYTTNLPIAQGDLVALDVHEGCIGVAGVTGTNVINWNPALPEGSTLAPPYPFSNVELGFNALVQPAPSLGALSVNHGSIEGGTPVTITGTDLEGASAVSFGGSPAHGFTVNSESQITATTPARATVGTVDVAVTTVAGTTAKVTADAFTYEGCVVPKLIGKSLKATKKKLKAGDCKLGRVAKGNGVTAKDGKVVKQHPKPKKILAPGSKVNVKLG